VSARRSIIAAIFFAACGSTPASTPPASTPSPSGDRYVITASRVYVSPDAPPLDDAWVEIAGGTIARVGTGAPPSGVRRDDECSGGVIAAGFTNSHVHFLDPAWVDAAHKPRDVLEVALAALTTRYGFTTVTDTGSIPADTLALRERIRRGELLGPTILTAGVPLYPTNGIPIYLRDLPPEILHLLQQPASADEARAMVKRNLDGGADGTKLFVVTPQGHNTFKRMDSEILAAAVAETHAAGKLVMVHPTDITGVTAAADAGVDIIVHTTIDPPHQPWPKELVDKLVARHISVVPTLQLWGYELTKQDASRQEIEDSTHTAEQQLAAFARAGGQVLFGTDVGYMAVHDPTEEYVRMAEAGLTAMQILASLTTAPAARWKASARRGRVAATLDADLVVLSGDPAKDVHHFTAVTCTIHAGNRVYRR